MEFEKNSDIRASGRSSSSGSSMGVPVPNFGFDPEEIDRMEFEKNSDIRASGRSAASGSSMGVPVPNFGFDPEEIDSFQDDDSPEDEVNTMRFKLRSLSIPFRNRARTRGSTRSTRSTSSMESADRNCGTHPTDMDMTDTGSTWSMEKPPSISESNPEDPTSSRPRSPTDSYNTMKTERSAEVPPSPTAEPYQRKPYAGPGETACSLCRGRKLRACKSCLTCVRSFCHVHVKDHYVLKIMESHQLVEATEELSLYQEIAKLKQMNTETREENIKLREELDLLQQQSRTTPKLPDAICKGRSPTPADVILDQGSAHPALVLSHNGKRVKFGEKSRVSPSPHRFNRWECVSASEGFSSGRHYWEVEVNKEFTIGVMRQLAPRVGRFTFAPSQGYWCVFHYWLSFSALSEPVQHLRNSAVPRLLGVCVDVDEKWVTFYNVESKELIYTFTNLELAQREKVYPVFRTLEKAVALQIRSLK